MPVWLRRTEVGAAVAMGGVAALLDYGKPLAMIGFGAIFLGIEGGWYLYQRGRGPSES